ncbi:MAG: leucine-rich repeat domain-containing protein, partial [Corallococcus sp.]|nr:leucine-rich repeat domain-containing protein [Corallococcus sp.]
MENENNKKSYTKYIIIAVAVIVALAAAIILIVKHTTEQNNIYTIYTMNQISLGNSQEKVVDILGEPNEKAENGDKYIYRGKSGDYIEVIFKDGTVEELFLDKDYGGSGKQQLSVSVEDSEAKLEDKTCNIRYSVRYADGSFYRGTAVADIVSIAENISGSAIKIEWEGNCGQTCSDTVYVYNESNRVFGENCYILNGTLTITNNDFDLTKIIQSNYDFRRVKDVIVSDQVWRLDFQSSKTDFKQWTGLENVYYLGTLNGWCNILFGVNPLEYAHNLYINNEMVENLTIDDTIANVPDKAFAGCESLRMLAVNSEDINIGDRAFFGCVNLASISFDAKVNGFGEKVFEGCANIGYAKIPTQIIGSIDTKNLTDAIIFGDGVIPQSVFENCAKLKTVEMLGDIAEIGARAFFDCTELTTVNFADSIEKIGDSAFEGCCKAEIDLSIRDLKYIGANVFNGCSSLQNLSFGQGIKEIGDYAFSGCEKLIEICIPNSLGSIGCGVFYGCNNITKMTLPFTGSDDKGEFVTEFYYIFGTSEDVPKGLAQVDLIGDTLFENAFGDCAYLRKVGLPNGILTIPENAFAYCTSLNQIDIPESVVKIEPAFAGCKSLITLTVPQNVQSISKNAFSGASKLIEIRNLSTVEVQTSSTLKNVYTELTDKKTIEKDGFVFYIDNGNYSLVGYNREQADIVLPETIDGHRYTLYKDTFRSSLLLKSVVIPNMFDALSDGMFADCIALESVTLPTGITKIGLWAFENCTSLKSITIPNGVTQINQHAFNGCGNLQSVNLPECIVFNRRG